MATLIGRALLSATTTSTNSTAHATSAGHGGETDPLWFIFISLFIGSLTRTALNGTSVPYTVVLFCLGMLEAVVDYYLDLGKLESSLEAWGNINPHVLLAAFLPALIFESSFSMEWHTLKKADVENKASTQRLADINKERSEVAVSAIESDAGVDICAMRECSAGSYDPAPALRYGFGG